MPLAAEEESLLAIAKTICRTVIEPRAEEVDRSGTVPRENLKALADAGLVRALVENPALRGPFTEELCAACGTTYFTLTQHLGSAERILRNGSPALQKLLPDFLDGRAWVGVGFGHLRRPQRMLSATPVPGGWTLSGVAPWVTGWPILKGTIYGAWLPDGRHVYLYAEASVSDAQRPSAPLPLCAMGATETVEVTLNDLFVPEENFLFHSSREELMRGDEANLAGNVAPMLGVATGSVRALRAIAAKKPIPAITDAADALTEQIDACRERCSHLSRADKNEPGWKEAALDARTGAIELGIRAAGCAVAAASGGANSLDHPAQRRFREAMFYSLFQQTSDILRATVTRLARSQCS